MILNWLRQHWRGLLVALVLGAAFLSGSWFGASKANTAWALKWKQRDADDATALAKRQAEARAEEQRRQGEIDAIEKRAEGQIAQAAADADHARAVSDGLRLGLADYELSCVQGRPAAGVFRRAAGGGDRLGSGVRQPDRTRFFRFLEIRQGNPGLCGAARKKIFRICKNFICICEKMGYNKVESSSGKTAKTKR